MIDITAKTFDKVVQTALESVSRDFSKKPNVYNYQNNSTGNSSTPKIPNLTSSGKGSNEINIIEFAGGHTIEIPKCRLVGSIL